MSMISAQIDELRRYADMEDGTFPLLASALRDAADTILGLRDMAQQEQAENSKLRKEVDNLLDLEHLTSVAVAYAGCDECGEYKQTMLRLFDENAKLRELVRDMLPFAEVGMDDTCVARRCCLFEQCEYTVGIKCAIEQHMLGRMRELGIEV